MEDNFVDLSSFCVIPSLQVNNTSTNNVNSSLRTQTTIPIQPAINVPGIAQSYFSDFTRYIKDTSSKVMQSVQK